MDFRSIFRRVVPVSQSIRIVSKNGAESIGLLQDVNHKGFRIKTTKKFNPGATLEGMFEFNPADRGTQLIPFTARCVWNYAKETGFAIKEIPMAREAEFDKLIDQVSGEA